MDHILFVCFLVLLVVVVQVNHPLHVPYLGLVHEIECVPFIECGCGGDIIRDDRYISVIPFIEYNVFL